MTSGPGAPPPDAAKCIVNGIAASSGCNVTNPSQMNASTTQTCVANKVQKKCEKDLKSYPKSPVKSSNGGGGGGDSKKGPSVLEIIIIVVAVLALLGLVGFLAYRAKK